MLIDPIHVSEGHWTLGVLDVKQAQFSYLDSLGPSLTKAQRALEPLKLWLDVKAAEERKQIDWHQELHLVPARGVIPKQYCGTHPNDYFFGPEFEVASAAR